MLFENQLEDNLLKYLLIFNSSKLNIFDNKLPCISLLIEKYKNKKDPEILTFISFFVEQFYNELVFHNRKNINSKADLIANNFEDIINFINNL